MELSINKEELVKGLARVQSVVEKRSSMPILSNVLLDARDDGLFIIATDLETSLESFYPARVYKTGKLTIPAKTFYQVVRESPTEEIYLKEKEAQQLHFTSGKFTTNFNGLPFEDFPALPQINDMSYLKMESSTLKEMIEKTLFSISQEETRFNLGGLYVQKRKPEDILVLRFVSTDGHRLSLIDREIEDLDKFNLETGSLIPRKGVIEMRRLAEEGGEINFGLNNNFALLSKDKTRLILRLQDSNFPDYDAVIPKSVGKKVIMNRIAFADVLKRVAIMAPDKSQGVKFDFRDGVVEISSQNPSLGNSKESFGIDYINDDFSAAFNYSYFTDVCSAMHSDNLDITFIDEQNPCIIKGEGDPGFLSVIMPMRI